MNFETLEEKGWIVFSGITGSNAYGTQLSNGLSDTDIRGLFILPASERLSLFDLPEEVSNENEDTKYFELKKFMQLAMKATPNILELLWLPPDCMLKTSPQFQLLLDNRNLFITKQAITTHAAYSIAQVKKARGQNKLVNNPIPKEKPERIDFCWFVPSGKNRFDTISMRDSGIDLSTCRASAIPHLTDCFHIYPNGSGVFKGDMLVFDSIPKDERETALGLMTYQQNGYESALKKWKEYWDWMKNRNQARWEDYDGQQFDYDRKNMLHTIRLMLSAENIIKNGEPIVRFTGDTLVYLRKIREGSFSYDELMALANEKMNFIESNKDISNLPESSDKQKINKIFKELTK